MNSNTQLCHEDEFEQAWADPCNTCCELPVVDVNEVLTKYYKTSEPLTFTRTMLWELETKKAWRPDLYIPSVVRQGTASAWGESASIESDEVFLRTSQQRLWLEPQEYGVVLERVCVNTSEQVITFIGAQVIHDRDGNILCAGTQQALFHVEHSVSGDESRPLNKWRVVHLTDSPEQSLIDRFTPITNDVWLPEFIEIYIRQDLEIELTRLEIADDDPS